MWLDLGLYFHSAMLVTTSWSCFLLLGHHWFYSQSLLWLPVLVPSYPGPTLFSPYWTHSLVLTWFPWNCRVNGVVAFYPTPSQITPLCALHSMYNDKVSKIGEVPKLLNRLLDCPYMLLGRTNIPRQFDRMIRVGLNCWIISWEISCWNCDCWIWLGGNWRLLYISRLTLVMPFGAIITPLVPNPWSESISLNTE